MCVFFCVCVCVFVQVGDSTSALGKAVGVVGAAGAPLTMNSALARHWGPERSVRVTKDPAKSLGISIVGGKVDISTGSGSPISGIFIKNVLSDSPAGRTGQLRVKMMIFQEESLNNQ